MRRSETYAEGYAKIRPTPPVTSRRVRTMAIAAGNNGTTWLLPIFCLGVLAIPNGHSVIGQVDLHKRNAANFPDPHRAGQRKILDLLYWRGTEKVIAKSQRTFLWKFCAIDTKKVSLQT